MTRTVEKSMQTYTPDIFRFEQNVMEKKNLDALYNVAKDRIAEQILAYICFDHQYNLLGHGIIDVNVFADKCGYSTGYLRQMHESPFQLQIRNMSKKPERDGRKRSFEQAATRGFLCETRLENAFFILANLPLDGSYISIEDNQKYVRKFLPFRAIERFTIVCEKGRGGKLMIHYQLSNEFRRNLSYFYRNTSLDAVKNLRPSGLNPLYFYLLKVRDACYADGRSSTTPEFTPSFDKLCEKADIPESIEPRFKKRRLKLAFESINKKTTLHFTVQWLKASSEGEQYVPIIDFIPSIEDIIEKKDSSRIINILSTQERLRNLANEFGHALIELYISRKGDLKEMIDDYFFEWIKGDDDQTLRHIAMVMQKAYVDTMNKIPGDIGMRVKKFNQYAKTKDKDEFQDWLYDIFNCGERIIPMKVSAEERAIDEQ